MLKSKNKIRTFCNTFFRYKDYSKSYDYSEYIREKYSDQRSLDILFNQTIFQNYIRHSFYKKACLIKENILQFDDNISKKYLSFLVENRDIPMDASKCEICFMFNSEKDDKIVYCDGCNVSYHQSCYSPNLNVCDKGKYYCDRCVELQNYKDSSCYFCNWPKGPLKKSRFHMWNILDCNTSKEITIDIMAHPYCVHLNPDLQYDYYQDHIYVKTCNMISYSQRYKNTCMICNTNKGAVVRCSDKNCLVEYHIGCYLNVLRLDQKVTHEFYDNYNMKCPFNHIHEDNKNMFDSIIYLRDKFVRQELHDSDLEQYIKMEQAVSWKGISELRKMKNSIELMHNCDEDDGWLRRRRGTLNYGKMESNSTSHPDWEADDATTVMGVEGTKPNGGGSCCDTNSKVNVPIFHIASKRKREKKFNLKKNINNLPVKMLQEKMKKIHTNNIKYDKDNKEKERNEKLTYNYVKNESKDKSKDKVVKDKSKKDQDNIIKNSPKVNKNSKSHKTKINKHSNFQIINKTSIEDDINSKITDQVRDEMLDFTDAQSEQDKNNMEDDNAKSIHISHRKSNKPKIVNLEKDNVTNSNNNKKRKRISVDVNENDSNLDVNKNKENVTYQSELKDEERLNKTELKDNNEDNNSTRVGKLERGCKKKVISEPEKTKLHTDIDRKIDLTKINNNKITDVEYIFKKIDNILSIDINEINYYCFKENINKALVIGYDFLTKRDKDETYYKYLNRFKKLKALRSKYKYSCINTNNNDTKNDQQIIDQNNKFTSKSFGIDKIRNENENDDDQENSYNKNNLKDQNKSQNTNNSQNQLIFKNSQNHTSNVNYSYTKLFNSPNNINNSQIISSQLNNISNNKKGIFYENSTNITNSNTTDTIIKPKKKFSYETKTQTQEYKLQDNHLDKYETSNSTIAERNINEDNNRYKEDYDYTENEKYSNDNVYFSKREKMINKLNINEYDLKRKRQ